MSDRVDLRVSGATVMPGGDYGRVSISGSGKIQGSLHADRIDCSGAAKVLGDVVTGCLNVSGAGKIEGSAWATVVDISGATKVQGDLTGEDMKLSGGVKIEGNLHSKQLRMSGAVSMGAGVEAEEVYSDGVLNVAGLLNAETIELHCGHGSVAGDIGCAQLSVRKTRSSGVLRLFGRPTGYALEVNSIEADAVDLEYTKAEVVRARDVRIGEGCRVRRVEYTGSCQAEEGAVQELVQINRAALEDSVQE